MSAIPADLFPTRPWAWDWLKPLPALLMLMAPLVLRSSLPDHVASGFCPLTTRIDAGGLHYPDASCTGLSNPGLLTGDSGQKNLSGTVTYENKDLVGCIVMNSGGTTTATIRNVKISPTSACSFGIFADAAGVTATIENVEIDCANGGEPPGGSGVGCTGIRVDTATLVTITSANIYGGENGIFSSEDTTLADSYIHDHVDFFDPPDPHIDGVQLTAGASNITIRRNTIFGSKGDGSTSVMIGSAAYTMGNNSTNILLDGNLFAGGLNCLRNENPPQTTVRGINNRFAKIFHADCGSVGNIDSTANFNTWTGNAWYEDGVAIN